MENPNRIKIQYLETKQRHYTVKIIISICIIGTILLLASPFI